LLDGAKGFAEAEAKFAGEAITAATTASNYAEPSISQLFASITKKKMSLLVGDGTQELTIEQAVKSFTTKKAKEIAQLVRDGAATGRTVKEMTDDITGLLNTRTKGQAESLVRTVTNHVGAVARSETYAANDDVIIGEEYVATLDSRTTVSCSSLDGQVFPIGQGPQPPLHWACLTPGTSVTPRGSVSYITKRPFDGQVVTIRTAGNKSVTVTLNHPVMTDRGFIPAKLLNKGDYIISGLVGDTIMPTGNNNKMEASIEEGFDSFIASGEMLACPVPYAAEDFHGDVAECEVGVVLINVELLDAFVSSIAHQYVERFLKIRSLNSLIDEACFSHFSDFVIGLFSANTCGVSVSGERLNLFRGRVIHSGLLLLRSISRGDAIFDQASRYNASRSAKTGGNASAANARVKQLENSIEIEVDQLSRGINISGFKGSVDNRPTDSSYCADFERLEPLIRETDTVIEVSFSSFSGHVYNLQCGDGVYSANSIITHNCRSVRTPLVNPKYNLGSKVTGKRSSVDGLVSADTTYGGWLKKQGAAVQDEVLGIDRAKLFRSGKLSIGRFTDDLGRVYSLEELERLNPLAFS
jgi:SPP1 gp7 family putative phage head morphogenesis protein